MTDVTADGAGQAPIWRPVQYLGTKLRALNDIRSTFQASCPTGATVWEPFAGSTVVSQALAADGFRVVAADALSSSAAFAASTLGFQRSPQSVAEVARIVARTSAAPTRREWASWISDECDAIKARDGARLLSQGLNLPQRWRSAGASTALTRRFDDVNCLAQDRRIATEAIFTTTYAGTYFGIHQSLEIDRIRTAIEAIAPQSNGGWLRASLLTALCHAASRAVFSPGKHFAQPHLARKGKDLSFHATRILSDRAVNIGQHFLEAATTLDLIARPRREGHIATQMLVENVAVDQLEDWGVSAIYADPPYTAQQYSRFYHILETIVTGIPPKLQLVKGRVTRGLYPDDKYLSPFCSRVRAPDAIRDLALTAAKAGATLVLSYSDARGASTGNARSVSLKTVAQSMEDAFGVDSVTITQLDFKYRQFNNAAVEVSDRHDPEYIIVGKRHAR